MTATRHLIGLLLGTETDWPRAFEEILRRLGPVAGAGGTRHVFECERITIEPFGLHTGRPQFKALRVLKARVIRHTPPPEDPPARPGGGRVGGTR